MSRRCIRFVACLAFVGCSTPAKPGTTPPADANAADAQDSTTEFDIGSPDANSDGQCDPDGLESGPKDALARTCRCPRESPTDPEFIDSSLKECEDCTALAWNLCFGVLGGPLMPPDLPA